LPVINHDRSRLDTMELYPFREAIQRGLTGIMVAHLQVPALDSRENRATTLSRPTITDLLKREMDFKGLIITDALNMKGLSTYFEPGLREVEAVKAGNDILLMPVDVGKAIASIKRAVRKGEIPEEEINTSCRKILQAKYWSGLHTFEPVQTDSIMEDLNDPVYDVHFRKLVEHSLTLARNRDSLLPLKDLQKVRLVTLTIGKRPEQETGAVSDLYLEGKHFNLSSSADHLTRSALLSELGSYNTMIIHLLNTSSFVSRNYGITGETIEFIEQLDTTANLILHVAGYPYVLSRFSNLEHVDAILFSYDENPLNLTLATQGIFGGIALSGQLPVSAGTLDSAGQGHRTGPPIRLGFSKPLDVGLNPDTLILMETVIREAIKQKAIPGCQLLVARKGKVVWHKAYGYHTFQRKKPVQLDDIYDLASVTKITATLPSLMRLRDMGQFHEDSILGAYQVVPGTSNKAGLLISDILTHQAGLVPWIPFYYSTLEPLDTSQSLISVNWSHIYPLKIGPSTYANRNVKYVDSVYQKNYSPEFPIQVAEDLYMRSDIRDTVYEMIYDSELLPVEYRYSDLGYYMLQQVVEQVTDTMLYPYVWYNFYAPLGAKTLGYLPLNRFPLDRIVPTENDMMFRRQLLHGHVHDMGAALLGGISGHAGLFGNSIDLAKIMQMYLNGGHYGGVEYFADSIIDQFNTCIHCEQGNRRGIGFDKPEMDYEKDGPTCQCISPNSFGHTGFTGTMVWADPDTGILYVFLSNKIHPDQDNPKLV
ncbi:MAG: serine hydrolase, partial [Bacteroidales bacterium]|nr:serine hydrolase [Bacteroidales bacterium]